MESTFTTMNNLLICYFNGDFLKYENLSIHVSDLLFQRGYGVFDFFRCRNGSLYWLDDYLDRFFNSAKIAGLEISMNRNELSSIIYSLQQKNGMQNGAFKLMLSGGYSDNLESVTGTPNLLILNLKWNRPAQEIFQNGVSLISEEFVRPNPETKTLYYFNSMRLQQKMKEFSAVDVMYFTNFISETSRANLFFVKEGRVSTPSSNILPGVTRKQILSMFPEIAVEDIDAQNRFDFDEMFISSTTREVTPVVMLDGHKIGKGTVGPITREIQNVLQKSWNK